MRLAWRLAVASFTVAALTGAFMRFGLYLGFPWGLQYGDVRHAHSHLMFFSWATPALALCADAALRAAGRRLPGGPALAVVAALAGLVAYVPFVLSGYRLMPIGSAELPLSMMASGLNGIVWYALALLYLLGSWGARRTPALRLMDGAVVMLVVSTVGVLLLMLDGIGGTGTPRRVAANAEYYTSLFADGWFGLGLLAALALTRFGGRSGSATSADHAPHGAVRQNPSGEGGFALATWALVIGLSVRSGTLLLTDLGLVAGLRPATGVGGLLAAAAWLWLAAGLWRRRPRVRSVGGVVAAVVLWLVVLKAVFELALALPAGEAFVESESLRVLLLHAYLLGAVTLGLASAARVALGSRAWHGLGAFSIAVGVMVLCLLPLTGLWPTALAGAWTLRAAAYSSLGPPLLAAWALSQTFRR